MSGERSHYPAIIDGARLNGALLYRIVDAPMTGKKPFDIMGISGMGRGVGIEVKLSKKDSLDSPLKLLEAHQLNWLKAFAARGGIALVIVYHSVFRDYSFWEVNKDGELVFLMHDQAGKDAFKYLLLNQ